MRTTHDNSHVRFQETGAPATPKIPGDFFAQTTSDKNANVPTRRTIRRSHSLARERILGTKGVGIFHDEGNKSRKRDILVVTGSSLRNAETVVLFKGRSCFARFDRKKREKNFLKGGRF